MSVSQRQRLDHEMTHGLELALRVVRRGRRGEVVGAAGLRHRHVHAPALVWLTHALVLTHPGLCHSGCGLVDTTLVGSREVHEANLASRRVLGVGRRTESHATPATEECAKSTEEDEERSSYMYTSVSCKRCDKQSTHQQ
jgi:hypothetical protein